MNFKKLLLAKKAEEMSAENARMLMLRREEGRDKRKGCLIYLNQESNPICVPKQT